MHPEQPNPPESSTTGRLPGLSGVSSAVMAGGKLQIPLHAMHLDLLADIVT